LEMNGESYRLKQSKRRQRTATAETADHQADTGSLADPLWPAPPKPNCVT
jgi:hypothetical protein